jgi:S1-C subfamily serine protease
MSYYFKQLFVIMMLLVYNASCGCATLFNPITFKDAPRESFVKVAILADDNIGTGSGVIISIIDKSTIILTAGHICKPNITAIKVIDLLQNDHEVIGMIASNEDDLCLLIVDSVMEGKPIKTSSNKPQIGQHAYNIAAPFGLHAENMSLMFHGYYQGQLKLIEEKFPLDLYSVPGVGGSSGSPIFDDDWNLIGIVSRGITGFPEIMLSVNYERVKAFTDYSSTELFRQEIINARSDDNKKMVSSIDKIMMQ